MTFFARFAEGERDVEPSPRRPRQGQGRQLGRPEGGSLSVSRGATGETGRRHPRSLHQMTAMFPHLFTSGPASLDSSPDRSAGTMIGNLPIARFAFLGSCLCRSKSLAPPRALRRLLRPRLPDRFAPLPTIYEGRQLTAGC